MAGTQWFMFKNGTCATNHFESGGFLKSDPSVSHPDIELQFVPVVMREAGKSEMIQHGYQVNCAQDPVSGWETLQGYPSKRVTLGSRTKAKPKCKLNLAPTLCKVSWDAPKEVLEAPFLIVCEHGQNFLSLAAGQWNFLCQLFPFQVAVSVTDFFVYFVSALCWNSSTEQPRLCQAEVTWSTHSSCHSTKLSDTWQRSSAHEDLRTNSASRSQPKGLWTLQRKGIETRFVMKDL